MSSKKGRQKSNTDRHRRGHYDKIVMSGACIEYSNTFWLYGDINCIRQGVFQEFLITTKLHRVFK